MPRERTGAHPPGAVPGTRKALRGTDALLCGARRNEGREGGGASPAQAPGSLRAHIAPGKGASAQSTRRAWGRRRADPRAAAGLRDAAVTPPLPRAPTCGCRRSPGGIRDVPDEQGGVGGPRVARHDRFLLSLRACPRPPGSLSLSLQPPPPQQLRRPPARPPPLGLGPASAQPQRRRGGGHGAAQTCPCGPRGGGGGGGAHAGPEAPGIPGGGGEGGRARRRWEGAARGSRDLRPGLR